jgi:hypothetical protein
MLFNKMNETRARLGAGSGVYTPYFQTDGKYALLAPLISVPFIGSETAEVEIRVASSNEITKLAGMTTYNASEANVYLHRDCIKLLNKVNGKTIPVLFMAGDFSGQKCDCVVTYTKNALEQENAWEGVVKFTPVTAPEDVFNAYPLVKPTAHIVSNVEDTVWLDKTDKSKVIAIETKYDGTSITATAEDSTIATATYAEGKLTITGVKVGSTLITLKTEKEGHASWETSILAIVTEI